MTISVENADIEWVYKDTDLIGVNVLFRDLRIQPDAATQVIYVRNRNRDLIAFRVASYLADLIYTLTGDDALIPQQVFTQSPDVEGENSEEKDLLQRTTKRNSVSIATQAVVSRALNTARLVAIRPTQIAIAHPARAKRATDPFDQFEEFFKAIESFAPKNAKAEEFDKAISQIAKKSDSTFTSRQVKPLREIRNRIVHSRETNKHLNPHNLSDIEQVEAHLADIERLATLLIWDTPTPWLP